MFGYFLFRENEVTIYLGIGHAQLDELPLQVSIDEEVIFNDTLVNNPFKYEVVKINLKGGFHSLSIATNNGEYIEDNNFLILYDQHLIIEYFSPCQKGKEQCFDVRNRFTKFRLE